MSDFVNFGKRSVELPAGCKDLIDVLQKAKRHPVAKLTARSAEGLADVAKHLASLLEPGAKSKNLVITWTEMNFVHLMNEEGALSAVTVVHEITHREQAVRGVFASAGLAPILDEAVVDGAVRVLRYTLPGGTSNIEELISNLLRTGYGLPENMKLQFGLFLD
jgi:hypothetical protein